MVEAGISLLIALGLAVAGLAAWRAVRGSGHLGRRIAAVSLVLLLLLPWAAWRLSKSTTLQLFGGIVPRVETSQPVVALTFDDGPTARFTDAILATLQEEGIKATFFVVGEALERNPTACQEIVAGGHELGNHSYSHQRMMLKSYGFIQQEIERTDELIRACGHDGEIHFRSPNGKKLLLLPYYLNRTGRKNISWDVAPEGEPQVAADAGKIVEYVLEETRPGSIILLHVMYESRAASREALPGIIRGLRAQGYRFVTVSELLAAGQ